MSDPKSIPVSTTNQIDGRAGSSANLGVVFGLGRSAGIAEPTDPAASTPGAGHVADAIKQMLAHAGALGADAVVGLRFDSTHLGGGAVETLAYGTAVSYFML